MLRVEDNEGRDIRRLNLNFKYQIERGNKKELQVLLMHYRFKRVIMPWHRMKSTKTMRELDASNLQVGLI
jgi:hypothetical protein